MGTATATEMGTDLYDVYIYYKPFNGEWHVAITPHGAEWSESDPRRNSLYRSAALTKRGAQKKAIRACQTLAAAHDDPSCKTERWVFSRRQ